MIEKPKHVQLQLDGRELPQHEARLTKLPCALFVLDLLLDRVDDAAKRSRILVDNPKELYGFRAALL